MTFLCLMQIKTMNKKINLLLVDDSALILTRLKMLLSDIKSIESLETASSLNEAKDLIERQKPDVIVLDIHLPDGNGILFLKCLKQRHPEIMIVMLTNLSDSFFKTAAEKYGADHFFDKSMEFEEIPKLLSEMHN